MGRSDVDAYGGYFDYDLAAEIMAKIDVMRVERGINELLFHPQIQEWAGVRAVEQVALFSHTRPDGRVYSTVGDGLTFENLMFISGLSSYELNDTSALAQRIVNNWYNSPTGHREAMLSASSNLAAVSTYVRNGTVYIVHLFSDRTMFFMDFLI